MKVRWEYFEEHIYNGNYVAIMNKDTGNSKKDPCILFVYIRHCYYASFCTDYYHHFKEISIPFSEVETNLDLVGLDYKERELEALKYACSKIEEKFFEQREKILDLIS